MIKRFICLIVFGLLFYARGAFASVAINEIMYDLDGGDIDWVEVMNNGSSDVDLSSLKLLIDNSTSNHSINNFSGSSILHAGDYGVIVQSSEINTYTGKFGTAGNIFTSSFSLPNDAGKIEINAGDKTAPLTSVSYSSSQSASGDGNSLQLISSTWVSANPTPSALNQSSTGSVSSESSNSNNVNSNTTTSNTSTSTTENTIQAKPKVTEVPKIKTEINSNTFTFTGIPITLKIHAFGYKGEELTVGKYFLNFGDGDSIEVRVVDTTSLVHTYFYPGEYEVTLEYYSNFTLTEPTAIDTATIKVISNGVFISKVGNENDFFIELSNNSNYDADISRWILSTGTNTFIFPKNTVIKQKDKLILSPKITHFNFSDKNDLKLLNVSNELVFTYTNIYIPRTILKNTSKEIHNDIPVSSSEDSQFEAIDLSAQVSGADLKNTNSSLYVWIFILFMVLISAIIFFIRKKRHITSQVNSEEFEILDE